MFKEMKRDDRGIALISVMVGVMLCLLLSATIMRVSYLSYLQKSIGAKTTSTFYENEEMVDDIKMGIQTVVAKAAIGVSSSSEANATKAFLEAVKTSLGASNTALNAKLLSFVQKNDSIYDVSVTVGGVVEDNNDLVIKNVLITYRTKPSGYLSKVSTDIRIRAPFYSVTPPSSSGSYSMFAGSGLTIPADAAKPSMLTIEGDIYVGYDPGSEVKSGSTVVSATAMSWTKWNTVYWPKGSKITINGDVCISGQSNLVILSQDVDIRGKIYVSSDSNVIIASDAKVTCQDIVVKASISSKTQGTVKTGTIYTPGYWHDNWNNYPDAPELPSTEGMESWEIETLDPARGRFVWNEEKSEDITVPKTVWTCSGTSVSANNFKSGTANTETYLPTYGESITSGTVYNHSGDKSGLYVWDGTKATHIHNHAALSLIENLTLDASNKVHPCVSTTVDGSTFYFDEEYVGLIDVDYFLKYALADRSKFETSKQLSSSQYETEGAKYKSKVSSLNEISSGGGRWQSYKYKNGGNGTASVEVMLGNVQTMNRSDRGDGSLQCHFAIGYQDVTLMNDQNTGAQSIGVYITPNKISCTAREGTSTIKALSDLAEKKELAKAFFDGLGREVMGVSEGKVPIDYQTVNNFFKSGIKVFYEDSGSSTNTGSSKKPNTVRNGGLDIVSLENWSKSYVEETPTS